MYLETIAVYIIFFYLGFLIYENYRNNMALKKIPLIIHVNGIRGKSAVSRLLDAGLRGSGVRVATKITGTVPIYIDTQGTEHRIRRLGRTTIREQLRVIKRAAGEKPDILIMECMAIDPRLQKTLQDRIVKSSISIITNVRRDHLREMGPELRDVARSLGGVTPQNGTLIVGEDSFRDIFEEICKGRNSELLIADESPHEIAIDFPENISVALEVCKHLKIDRDRFVQGMKKNYREDLGKFKLFKLKNKKENQLVADGLAVNDVDSIERIYNMLKKENENISILINNRIDRMERALEMIQWAKGNNIKKVILTGENLFALKRRMAGSFEKIIIEDRAARIIGHMESKETLFMVGNIKGMGEEIINTLQMEGERIG